MNASFDGSYGNELTNANLIQETKVVSSTSAYSNIRREAYFEAWTTDNPTEKYPALGKAMGAEELKYMTDRWVEDASFLRISNVSLSYKLPLPKNKVVQNVSVGVSGRNLYVFTKYSGWDPEVSSYGNSMARVGVDLGSYPTARTYCFDVRLTF